MLEALLGHTRALVTDASDVGDFMPWPGREDPETLAPLVELMGRACNLGFAVPEPAGWRLLPAVCRYLDHFESLALTAKTDGDEESTPAAEDWTADAPDDEENT